MKKNNIILIILVVFILLLFLYFKYDSRVKEINNNLNNTKTIDNNEIEKVDDDELIKTNILLVDEVFVSYSDKVGVLSWNSAKESLDKDKYKNTINEPNKDTIGKIKIYDENNNYVFLSFYPKNGSEILSMLTYESSDNVYELSINNNYHTSYVKYNLFDRNSAIKNREFYSLNKLLKAFNDSINK